MSTLYLDRKNLLLKLDCQSLALYENNEKRGNIPFHLLNRVVVRGNAVIESRVLCALSDNSIDILFLSGRHSAAKTMAFSHSHNDVRRKLIQYDVCLDTEQRLLLSRQLVSGKLNKQLQLLKQALSLRKDLRKPLFDASHAIENILLKCSQLQLDDCSLASIRGLEGSAAALYFSAYKTLFAASLNFNARQRRPPPDPVNACLSLGYTLLHFEAVSLCHCVGLEPKLGFYHEPSFRRDSLACDLIEPLRPRVDGLVWSLFKSRKLTQSDFSQDGAACLLNKKGRQVFYAQYELFMQPLRRLLRIQAWHLVNYYQSLETCLDNETIIFE